MNLSLLFDTSGFPSRWNCGSSWTTILGWTHIIADLVIFFSYFSIPICIFLCVKKNQINSHKHIFILFAAFIFACGLVHLVEATIFWHPWYRLSATIKVITAVLSILTLFTLLVYIPKIINIPNDIKLKYYLEYIIDNIPEPLMVINENGVIKLFNKKLSEYTKFLLNEIINKSYLSFFEDSIKVKEIIKEVLNVKHNKVFNFKILNKEQEVLYTSTSFVYLNHNNKKEIMIGFKDLSQSRELELTTKKLNAIIIGAVDGIISFNSKGIIQSFNKAAEKIFEYLEDEVIGKNIEIIIPNACPNDPGSYTYNYINGHPHLVENRKIFEGKTKEGRLIPIEVSRSGITIDNEHTFTAIIRNIEENLKMEQKIKIAYDELESFSYIAAHDLREPLRGISNYSTFLLEDYGDKLDEDGKIKLKTLQKLSKRLEGFIESLLHLARLDTENVSSENVDLNILVLEVLSSLDITIKQNNVNIVFEKNMPTLFGDKIKVEEIFHNLIVNGIKYNNKDNKIIEIGSFKNENNIDVFYVKDNGIGINKEHFVTIFKMFKRLHPRDSFGGGSGAGLAIVKKIINQYNGDIWVESEQNIQTTFYFTLRHDDNKQ